MPGGDQVAGEALFPDALGNPHPADLGAEPVFQPFGEGANLADPIARRNHRQDRLVKRPADDLDPPRGDMAGQPIEIFRMMRVEPFHQRAAGVQRDPHVRILLEHIEKRPIAVLIGLLENAVEIADRLMIVQGEDEANHGRIGSEVGGRSSLVCRSGIRVRQVVIAGRRFRLAGLQNRTSLGFPKIGQTWQDRQRRIPGECPKTLQSARTTGKVCPIRSTSAFQPASGWKPDLRAHVLPSTAPRPFCATAVAGIQRAIFNFPQERGRILRRHRIDVKTGAPFEAGRLRQARNNLYMPVIVRQLRGVKRGRVNDVVVRRPVQRRLDPARSPAASRGPAHRRPAFECSRSGSQCCFGRIQVSNGNRLANGQNAHESPAYRARSAFRSASSCWTMSQNTQRPR